MSTTTISPLAVICGNEATNALLEIATILQSNGYRLAILCSPTISQALLKVNLPHIPITSPQEVQNVLTDHISLVLSLPPTNIISKDDAIVLKEQYETLSKWISGPYTFVRSAAWNYKQVAVITTEEDLLAVPSYISSEKRLSYTVTDRRHLAEKAFRYFATLDACIANSFQQDNLSRHDVLVIGGGGREHTIAWKLAQSSSVGHVYVAPGNAGTARAGDRMSNVPIAVNKHEELIDFAKRMGISLCVVGPEAPLVAGLADEMTAAGIPTFGPSARAAQLEASKAFSKDFMKRNGIPTASYENFKDYEKAKAYLEKLDYSIVIKASGIAAGKGVLLPQSKEEALKDLEDVMVNKAFGSAGDEVVIEELLTGEEVSLLAFSDGTNVITMPAAQDHKRIFDNDQGPNTGGMGAYAPAPCLTPGSALEKECIDIVEKTIAALKQEGLPYVGVLYPGFMLTPTGPKILEYNCRFGDPETQVLLPLLQSDLFEIMMACVQGSLEKSMVNWRVGAAATIVMASGGYPDSYAKGKVIYGVEPSLDTENIQVFHAGTALDAGQNVITSGGRVLAVSATADTLDNAVRQAYSRVRSIVFEGHQFRSDIALKGLLHSAKPIKLGVLGSTRGSSLQPIIDAIEKKELNASIEIVISNKATSGIIDRAKKHNIAAIFMDGKDLSRSAFDQHVSSLLRSKGVDLVLLVGYMRILSKDFTDEWQNKVINVHPSLLPDFAGGMDLAVHQAVIDAKKKESGCTIHFVTEKVDGGPIVIQQRCPVSETDTAESLKAKVQALEGPAFIHAIRLIQTNMCLPALTAQKKEITYAAAGVSIDAGNQLVDEIKPYCKSTVRTGCDADLGGFGGLFDLEAAGYSKNTVLVACTDGVGTKLRVAQSLKSHTTVGIDLVAMCVNDLLVQGAEPLFFLDYYACGELSVTEAADVVKGIAEGCRQSNCGLIGGETAEMPSMYAKGDYDIAGFCIGAVEKSNLLPVPVQVGDVVLGLSSSGVHSNGFSLVRKLVEVSGLTYYSECPYDSTTTLGLSLLTPTKIYVKALMPVINRKGLIHALAHITGGGLLENIPRVLSKDMKVVIDLGSWSLPPVFKWLKEVGNLSTTELSRTFNCGIGMVVILPENNVNEVMDMLKAQGESVYRLGTVCTRKCDQEQVELQGTLA